MDSGGGVTAASFLRDAGTHLRALVVIGLVSIVAVWAIQWYTSPLRRYPGPLIASLTNFYRMSLVLTNEYQVHLTRLHEKYGPVVRIGPNALDLDYPELIKTIYGTDNKWLKTKFYHPNSTIFNGKIKYTVFSTPDQDENRRIKRPVVKHYAPGAVRTFEPLVDDTLRDFCGELERRFVSGPAGRQTCDLGSWIAYCMWDIVGYTTFSKPFGYMEKGCDFDNIIKTADSSQDYFSAVGQMWWLDYLLDKNPIKHIGPPSLGHAIGIAVERIGLRASGKDANFNPEKPDYLELFLEARKADPEYIDDFMLVSYCLINLVAGADTTASSVRAIMYYIMMNPDVHEKLKKEVRSADLGDIATHTAAKSLPYLDAVIKEAMRMHPGVAMMLERAVPPDGLKLPDGSYVPPGTAVGINPYIVQRNPGVYGPDADTFRPERWLQQAGEADEAFQERVKLYNRTDLAFGAGARICLGRHLSLLESYKFVATLINKYDLEIENGGKDYKTINRWFFRQEGLKCKVSLRE